MSEVTNFMHISFFAGEASWFATREEKVTSRNQISTFGSAKRAANLFLNMADVARKVCMTVGENCVGNNDRAQQISRIFRE